MKNKYEKFYESCTKRISGHGVVPIQKSLLEMLNFVDPQLMADRYGTGTAIENFEEKIARTLGKEAALFFPSGTMTQQIALRHWADLSGNPKVLMHSTGHLAVHEENAYQILHSLEGVVVGDLMQPLSLQDIERAKEKIGTIVMELPQRHSAGSLASWQELESIRRWCDQTNTKLHMDGARLWECQEFYQKTPAQISALFDSVYVSFYKGLGAVGGAALAGPKTLIESAKVWQRRHGGNLAHLFPLFVSADYGFETRLKKMSQYFARAQEIAEVIQKQSEISLAPQKLHTNMMHLSFNSAPKDVEEALYTCAKDRGEEVG